ncbi:MAG: hypothetical protein KJP02_04530 [Octadecabacter sp.]|nr:hypothetical protein [Octadecabacter sp.]
MAQMLPSPPAGHLGAFWHFARRLRDRFGPELDALHLWWRWSIAIERGGGDIATFRGRLDRRGRRLWEVDMQGRAGFVVYDHDGCVLVTIMTDDETIKCGAKGQRRIRGGFTNVTK